jgi:hypothetical protein
MLASSADVHTALDGPAFSIALFKNVQIPQENFRMKRLFLSLFAFALSFAALFATAPAGAASGRASTVIQSFTADPVISLTPGTEIVFVVEGTPKGKASVRINNVPRTINLSEVDAGVYEGTYTIRNSDRIAPNAAVRASLKARGRTAVATLYFRAAAAPAAAAPVPQQQQAAAGLRIERFTLAPVDKLEPGVDLRFTVLGTPGARATVGIQGVNRDVPMNEVKPGQYEAAYTVRRLDNFPPSGDIVARLEAGGQTARMRLNQSLLADAKPPVLKNLFPRDGETVPQGQISISGSFDDSGGLGVEPRSVRILVDGRDVTQNASVTPQFFTYRVSPPPGSHRVEVTAQDLAGNTMRQGWSFNVGTPVAAGVPLEITSHPNNAMVSGGATEVRGRTAPGATVEVKVTQTASVVGLFGVNQEVLNQSVRADANGNFAFKFQPQFTVPGARYEITMKAQTPQGATREMQLVLFQQK